MASVTKDKIEVNDDSLYYMYRDVRERGDDEKIRQNKLRYDLTVILPRMLENEFNKTFGHYHPSLYPEVYEVISGRALYLLQKPGESEDQIEEAYLIEVNAGEKVVMPPHFGHITINPLPSPLVMSNWVCDDFNSQYESYQKHQGGAFYITKTKIIKNKHYQKLSKLIRVKPKELPRFALKFGKPMYASGTQNIKALNYLVNPEKFKKDIEPESVFI